MTSVESNNWFPFQSLYNTISNGSPPEPEVKEKSRVQRFKAGEPLSPALREALGIKSRFLPPPWLGNMQRYGPPPSYPDMDICGLNSPLPHNNCRFGYHPGGWGYPSVDTLGNPVYGGNPFDEPCVPRKEANLFAARIQSLVKTFLIRCRFLRKRRAATRIAALGRGVVTRRRLFKAKIWATVIQAYGRRFMERQRYLKTLEHIITAQSCARRFLIVNSEDLRKAKAAKSERKQLAQDAARISVRKFMRRFRKKQDKERKEREKVVPGAEEEDDSLMVDDSVLCQTLDASHFCMEDSVLTRILDNETICVDENAFCRVLDAVENPEDESEPSDHGLPGKGGKTKGLKEEVEVVENGFCYDDSIFTQIFENEMDTVLCGVLDDWDGKEQTTSLKDPEISPIENHEVNQIKIETVDSIEAEDGKVDHEAVSNNEEAKDTNAISLSNDEDVKDTNETAREIQPLKVEVAEALKPDHTNDAATASLMDGISMSSDHSTSAVAAAAQKKPVVQQAASNGKDVVPTESAVKEEHNHGVTPKGESASSQLAAAGQSVDKPMEVEAPNSEPSPTLKATGNKDGKVVGKFQLPRSTSLDGEKEIDVFAADALNAAAHALTMSNSEIFATPSHPLPFSTNEAAFSPTALAGVRSSSPKLSNPNVAVPTVVAAASAQSPKRLDGGKIDPDGVKANVAPFAERARLDEISDLYKAKSFGTSSTEPNLLGASGLFPTDKPFTHSSFLTTQDTSAGENAGVKINGAAERLRKQMESLTAVRAEIDEMLRVSGRVVYKNALIPTTTYHSPTTVQSINFGTTTSTGANVLQDSPIESPSAQNLSRRSTIASQPNEPVADGAKKSKSASEADKLVESILDSCRQQAAVAARLPRAPGAENTVSSARALQFLVHQKNEQHAKHRSAASTGSETGTGTIDGDQSTIQTWRATVTADENSGCTGSAIIGLNQHGSQAPFVFQPTDGVPPALPPLQADALSSVISNGNAEASLKSLTEIQPLDTVQNIPNASKNVYKSRASYLLALAAAKKHNGLSGASPQARIST